MSGASAKEQACGILNDLYAHEARSLLPRLAESGVFVAWANAGELALVQRMIREEKEHQEWLIRAIEACDGSVYPAWADVQSANLHYLNMGVMMPRIIQNVEELAKLYADAATLPDLPAPALDVVKRIAARHRQHLDALTRLHAQAKGVLPARQN